MIEQRASRTKLETLEQLLHVASLLPQREPRSPSREDVVEALGVWMRAVSEHADTLETELAEILGRRIDPVSVGRRVQATVLRDPVLSQTVGFSSGTTPFMLMSQLHKSTGKLATPEVWILGRCGPSGAEFRERVEPLPLAHKKVPSTAETQWRTLVGNAMWHELDYVSSSATSFTLCFYWHGTGDVDVMSNGEHWKSEPWLDEDGNVLGTKFSRTFKFSNLEGKLISIEVSPENCKGGTVTVRVDNPHASQSQANVPEPIFVPKEVKHPPQGPGPVVIPGDLTAAQIDPRDVGRILDVFTRFSVNVQRALPRVVRETMTAERLQDEPGVFDHLLHAAVKQFG